MYQNVSKCILNFTEKALKTKGNPMFSRLFRLAEKERFELYPSLFNIRVLRILTEF
jgi:hypothetical protein